MSENVDMKKHILGVLAVILFLMEMLYTSRPTVEAVSEEKQTVVTIYSSKMPNLELPKEKPVTFPSIIEIEVKQEENKVSEEDIRLIALMTMTEAESEPEVGQRLVIDSVLNRVDDPHFPDTIHNVIWQPHQYCGMESPRIDQCWVKEELVQLVREELKNRTNYDVVFFRTQRYSDYGVPMFQVGAHYFSSYN